MPTASRDIDLRCLETQRHAGQRTFCKRSRRGRDFDRPPVRVGRAEGQADAVETARPAWRGRRALSPKQRGASGPSVVDAVHVERCSGRKGKVVFGAVDEATALEPGYRIDCAESVAVFAGQLIIEHGR